MRTLAIPATIDDRFSENRERNPLDRDRSRAKILGVVALLAPGLHRLREWAYAGFAITFISAFIAHTSSGDPASVAAAPLVALTLLAISYATCRRARAT